MFAGAMSRLGVGDEMEMVVYEQANVFSAPRARWMLQVFGARGVYLLDGGLQAWEEAGLPTEEGPVHRPPATFQARPRTHAAVSFPQVQQAIVRREQILDARPAGRFDGSAPEPRAGISSGHMPGSINVPSADLMEANRMKNAAQLAALFTEKHVDLQQGVITTCGSGITAAVVALGLEMCGAHSVQLYDGSWAEYAQHPDAVIETSRQGRA